MVPGAFPLHIVAVGRLVLILAFDLNLAGKENWAGLSGVWWAINEEGGWWLIGGKVEG